jgi:hypothetical protein
VEYFVSFVWMAPLFTSAKSDFPYYNIEKPVLAWLDRRDFARAREQEPGFSIWGSHSEFRRERDALYLGYGAAGVRAHIQHVPFAAFEGWARLTGAPLDLDGLDEFAAHWRWRADNPQALICARFGEPGDPERNAIEADGAQCLRVRPENFVRWRDDFAKASLFVPPSLDAYAAHVVECCILSKRRSRWPRVRSS